MKRPRWVTSVGVLGIILGGLGILGAIQTLFMPQMISALARLSSQGIARGPHAAITDLMLQVVKSIVDDLTVKAPTWYRTWLVCLSVAIVLVFTTYTYASVRLLKMRPHAIRWFTSATLAVGALRIVEAIGTGLAMPMLMLAMVPGITISLTIYIVLLAIVLVKSRRATRPNPPPLPVESR